MKQLKKYIKKLLKFLKIYDIYIFRRLSDRTFRLSVWSANFYDNKNIFGNSLLFECGYKKILKIFNASMSIKFEKIIIIYTNLKEKNEIKRKIIGDNIIFCKKNTTNYIKYMSQSKYLIFENNIPAFFIKKEEQIVFKIVDNKKYENVEIWDTNYISRDLMISDYIIYDKKDDLNVYLKTINVGNMFLGEFINYKFFKNKKWNKTVTKKKNIANKKTIVIFPSYLKGNGVTETFITLLNEIDYDKYNIYVILNNRLYYKDKQLRINKKANIVYLGNNRFFINKEEKNLIESFSKRNKSENGNFLDNFAKRNINAIVGTTKFDYAIDYNGYSSFNTLLIAKGIIAKEKIVYMHSDIHKDMRLKNFQLKSVSSLYEYFDRIICVSKSSLEANKNGIANYVKEKFGINIKDKMNYIINPINYIKVFEDSKNGKFLLKNGKEFLQIEKPNEKNNILIEKPSSDNYNFITIGRLSPEKNQKMLIESFIRLEKKYSNVKLYIVGEGVLYYDLKSFIDKNHMQNKVILTGYSTNPFALLNMCDCFVLPSIFEGMGIVVIESLILNKNVISSNIEGPAEFLKNGYGILVDPGIDEFYKAMEKVLLTKKNSKKFDYIKHNAEAMNLFYKNILGEL